MFFVKFFFKKFFLPKIFLLSNGLFFVKYFPSCQKIFFCQNSFFFLAKCFLFIQNLFIKIFVVSKFLLYQNFFLVKNCFWSKIFVGQHDALPNPFKKYDETTFQSCLTRPPSVVGHAAKICRKKSNSKLIDLQENLDDSCKNKIFELLT